MRECSIGTHKTQRMVLLSPRYLIYQISFPGLLVLKTFKGNPKTLRILIVNYIGSLSLKFGMKSKELLSHR